MRQGLLRKRPQRRSGKLQLSSKSRQRYFVLTDISLAYYEYDAHLARAGMLKGYISTKDIRAVRAVISGAGKQTSYFEVRRRQHFSFQFILYFRIHRAPTHYPCPSVQG